jgi:ABC-type antimicrobial peptide transport system permease subunit
MKQTVRGLGGLFVFRLAASLASTLGVLGLILALVGTYGVVSFGIAQRTHEIGIRMALGAQRANILSLVSRYAITLIGAGVLSGLLIAGGLTLAMRKILMGVCPNDTLKYVLMSVLLAAVSLAACWIPARRASGVDPAIALRYE